MSYQQLDPIADAFSPLLGLTLIVAAIWMKRAASPLFLLRVIVAVVLAQQIAKFIQKQNGFSLGRDFPSTHFAVALALCVPFWFLGRKPGALASVATALYLALMLLIFLRFGKYHSPLELAGSLYAVPLAMALQWRRRSSTKGATVPT